MPKIEVHDSEMSAEMQREALQVALLAVNTYKEGNDIANYIKKEFDKRHEGTWQCIIDSCGYSVSYKSNGFIRFSVGGKKITLFKTA